MVTFKLVFKNSKRAVYCYYPEGHTDMGCGIIIFDLRTGLVSLHTMAEDDYARVITKEELNESRDSINQMLIEQGEQPLTEEKLPIATRDLHCIMYADNVISEIVREYKENHEIPQDGTVAWC